MKGLSFYGYRIVVLWAAVLLLLSFMEGVMTQERFMKTILTIVLVAGLALVASVSDSVENKGAENITLQGGSLGNVTLGHHKHQNALGGCNVCHSLFPQASGSIEKLEGEGQLKNQEVMKKCRACHRDRAAKREKAGPTACNGCHKK